MIYDLKHDCSSINELKDKIIKGARFIVFQYSYSIIALSFKSLSSAILIEDDQDFHKRKRKYNILTLIFGWWSFPAGPFNTIGVVRFNNSGGVDMTEEILANLTEEDFLNKEVFLLKPVQIFDKPDKWDRKSYNKVLKKRFERDAYVETIVVAMFVDTDVDVDPHRCIGLKTNGDFDKYVTLLQKELFREFKKNTYFEFIDLNDNSDDYPKLLMKQGEVLFDKNKYFS